MVHGGESWPRMVKDSDHFPQWHEFDDKSPMDASKLYCWWYIMCIYIYSTHPVVIQHGYGKWHIEIDGLS